MLSESDQIFQRVRGYSRLYLAMSFHEKKHDTYPGIIPVEFHNAMAVRHPSGNGRWMRYPSYAAGARAWVKLLITPDGPYAKTVTLRDLINVYAPSFENDVERYLEVICDQMNSFPVHVRASRANGPSDAAKRGKRDPKEWDAATYHRVSLPHVGWGQRVLDRLPLRGDETVLDAGCGSGKLTAELLARLPRGRVIAVDGSANMLAAAADHLRPRFGDRVTFLHADLRELTLAEPVDAIFSTATFHWISDHSALFRRLHAALAPGGYLVAQCGGGPNLAQLRAAVATLMTHPRFSPIVPTWREPWEFADDATTAARLTAARFVEVVTTLDAAPTTLPDADTYRDFLASVVLHPHLAVLPDDAARTAFLTILTERATTANPPYFLDYWRLNLHARRPA
jgi:trans-aconitate methyltransferase